MKELESPNTLKPDTELSVQLKQQKEFKLIGHQGYHNGHKCWEYNTETKEINEAEYERTDIVWSEADSKLKKRNKRVIVKQNCIYVTALNKTNALKKLQK